VKDFSQEAQKETLKSCFHHYFFVSPRHGERTTAIKRKFRIAPPSAIASERVSGFFFELQVAQTRPCCAALSHDRGIWSQAASHFVSREHLLSLHIVPHQKGTGERSRRWQAKAWPPDFEVASKAHAKLLYQSALGRRPRRRLIICLRGDGMLAGRCKKMVRGKPLLPAKRLVRSQSAFRLGCFELVSRQRKVGEPLCTGLRSCQRGL